MSMLSNGPRHCGTRYCPECGVNEGSFHEVGCMRRYGHVREPRDGSITPHMTPLIKRLSPEAERNVEQTSCCCFRRCPLHGTSQITELRAALMEIGAIILKAVEKKPIAKDTDNG